MKNEHHDMRKDEDLGQVVCDAFREDASEDVRPRMREALNGFRADLKHHPYVLRGMASGRSWIFFPATMRAGLATLVVLLALAWIVLLFTAGTTPTWAQVEATFKSVRSFQATVYFKNDALAQPAQIELWMGHGGQGRMRDGNSVVFGDHGEITNVFDVSTGTNLRDAAPPNTRGAAILAAMTSSEELSLQTIIQWVGGDLAETTPMVNASAAISEDLTVFDIQSPSTPEWLRIWVLCESGLPIHLRSHDPRDGESLEVVFTYAAEQPPDFFDAKAYEQFVSEHIRLGRSTSADNGLAYAFLTDPGGKPISTWPRPETDAAELFATTMPTLDGEPWPFSRQKGKTILLVFWGANSWERPGDDWLDWFKAAHAQYGRREDFAMVGIALGDDMDALRTLSNEAGVDIPNLHTPGRPFDNALVKALGVEHLPSVWLIRKDGSVEEVQRPGGQLEGALLGFSYASAMDQYMFLSKKRQERLLTEDDARNILGEPASTEVTERGTEWHYRAVNQTDTKEAWLDLTFDTKGTLRGSGQGTRIIDPAIVTITIGEQCWREQVLAKLDPNLLRKNDGDCILQISGRTANTMSPFYGPKGEQEAAPGISYTRQLVAGVYRFTVGIYNTKEHTLKQEIVLRENVELQKNQQLDLHID